MVGGSLLRRLRGLIQEREFTHMSLRGPVPDYYSQCWTLSVKQKPPARGALGPCSTVTTDFFQNGKLLANS